MDAGCAVAYRRFGHVYIVIVGAGDVGNYLARMLVQEKHDVAIIEQDEDLARSIELDLDGLVIQGSGVSKATLQQAGIDDADLLIAVTGIDEINLVCCMVASRVGKHLRTVARVRAMEYLGGESAITTQEMGLSLIVGPERAVASQIVRQLSFEGAGEIRYLANNRLVLLELPLSSDSPLVHETLAELRDVLPVPSLVAGIHGKNGLRIPRGDDRLAADERADILTTPDNIDEFLILSGKPWHKVKHTLIIGCGTIGFHLAKELESQRMYPTIVEIDRSRAEWVSKQLTKSIVLHGDGTDPDLLRERLAEVSDAVVVLVDDDEKAVLVGLFAKELGAKKVIVRCDKLAYAPIAHKLGVDALISPRRAVANAILRFVRKGDVAEAFMLGDHDAEIIEIRIGKEPRHKELIEKPLRELKIPGGALVGGVVRGDSISIATGATRLQPGDTVFVITVPKCIEDVEDLFG